MDFGAELLVSLPDLSKLVVDGVKLHGNGYYAQDSGTKNGLAEGITFTSCDGLEDGRGEFLDQVGVELKAILGFSEDSCQQGEGGRRGG